MEKRSGSLDQRGFTAKTQEALKTQNESAALAFPWRPLHLFYVIVF